MPSLAKNNNLRIAITLPYLYMVRDFLFTPVWEEMAKRKDVHFFLLHSNTEVGKLISERGCPNVEFVQFPPANHANSDLKSIIRRLLRRDFATQLLSLFFLLLDLMYLFDSLGQRFVAVNDLSHYRIRKGRSPEERKRQQILFEYRKGDAVGRPFIKSRLAFRFLYRLRHGFFNIVRKEGAVFLQKLKPDLFVFGRLHFPETAYWAKALRRSGIPIIGIVSSWDHPTTKGPTPRGMSGYVVASRRMVDEMCGLHGIGEEKICQVGKVQMDEYVDPSIFSGRKDFLKKIGAPPEHRLVTFGTNTTGLKEHEVSIAQKLSKDFVDGRYGNATLLLRIHPQDVNWERDFLFLAKPPSVLCISAASFGTRPADGLSTAHDDQVMLANLMKYSDIVIQSRGSLALDAIAFDTPVISLAFDGDLPRAPNDSFLLEYEFEHYKPLVSAQGTWMVGSYEELERAIDGYLGDPTIHSAGRRVIREEHMEPLDGKASKRLIDYLVESAKKAREGTIPDGDWSYTGLGDVKWASCQVCKVEDYVQK